MGTLDTAHADTLEKDKPTGKTVLLFSGGMDSLMMAHLLRPDVLLYVRHGARYEEAELRALRTVMRWLPPHSFAMENVGLSRYERSDAIVPLRNLFFVAFAALHGERILIGAMEGDRSLDKSPAFFHGVAGLLGYLYGPQHWCEPRSFDVEAPFKATTKTELVARYLAEGGAAEALHASLSCYDVQAGGKPCGVCKPCFRKWVALQNNGIQPAAGYHAYVPSTAPWLAAIRPQVEAGTYRGREDADWCRALGWPYTGPQAVQQPRHGTLRQPSAGQHGQAAAPAGEAANG